MDVLENIGVFLLLQGDHVDDASYRLDAFDKDWTLDVKKNK